MKAVLIFMTITILMSSGCSKTWSGIKQDTSEVYQDTKSVIHEATAPSYTTSEQVNTLQPLPKVKQPKEVTTL